MHGGRPGAHRTEDEKAWLAEQARRLREHGRTRRQIEAELHVGGILLSQLLEGTVVPDALRRPRARDDARALARQLRVQGWTYDQIARELRVAKSSCSLWLRDLPHPGPRTTPEVPSPQTLLLSAPERRGRARELRRAGLLLREIADELGVAVATASRWCGGIPAPARARHGADAERARDMAEQRWAPQRAARDAARDAVHAAAAAALGAVTARDLLVALAVSYWCEGAKAKPWNPTEAVRWTNSDPGLVALFLAGLAQAGVPRDQIAFRVSIHARADESAARTWWAEHVGVDPASFARTTLKRHNPTTVRHVSDEAYRGCLTVSVRGSRELYQHLDGLVQALVRGAVPPSVGEGE